MNSKRTMRTQFIVNSTAGRGLAAQLLGRLQTLLARYGVEGEVVHTQAPGHAVELARQAALTGYERVVAMGGDGTINQVANGLLSVPECQAVLGILPAGSGNDFAHAMSIPKDLEGACQRLVEGRVATVDVIRVTVDGQTHLYCNAVGIGLDAEVLLETLKITRLRGFALYGWALMKILFTNGHWPYPMRIWVDDRELPHRAVTLITVANGQRVAGGFRLTPQARTDDGLLDVCLAGPVDRFNMIFRFLAKAAKGTHIREKEVTSLQGRRVVIEGLEGLPAHMDGEVLCTAGRRVEFEILPGRLKVWC